MLTEEAGVVISLGAKKLATVVAEAGVAEAGVKRMLTEAAMALTYGVTVYIDSWR